MQTKLRNKLLVQAITELPPQVLREMAPLLILQMMSMVVEILMNRKTSLQ